MATHRLPIYFNGPDSSGEVYPEPASVGFSNAVFGDLLLWVFDDPTQANRLAGQFTVPQNYVDTANIVVVWTSDVTSNDFDIHFSYRAVGGNDTESLDQATVQETLNDVDVAPSASYERMEFSLAATDGNFAAGDTVFCLLGRDSASDTLVGKVWITEVFFEYNDA